MNHETSLVPFPFPTPPTPTTEANSQNDFENAQVSLLTLSSATAGVLEGSLAIPSAENYQRFCSNFLATKAAGFNRPIFFTNEEGIDWVKRAGTAWPADGRRCRLEADRHSRRARRAERRSRPIWGMGRHNHENSLAVQGYGHPVVLSGDDSFVERPGAVAGVLVHRRQRERRDGTTRRPLGVRLRQPGEGRLLRLRPRRPDVDHGPLRGGPEGHRDRAEADGTELMAADKGYPLPPPAASAGSGTPSPARARSTGRSGCSSTGATSSRSPRSSSCASRTWRTTSGPAWRTSSTSPTQDAVRGRTSSRRRTRPVRRTGGSGRWCSTRTTRRRSSRSRS